MTYPDGYDDAGFARLAATDAWEITFMSEDFVRLDSTVIGGYEVMNTGSAFQVLGGVANGILNWVGKNRRDYLYWYAQGTRRQRLYDRMIRYFVTQGSGCHSLAVDPSTGLISPPEAFWLGRLPHSAALSASSCIPIAPSRRMISPQVKSSGILSASNEAGRAKQGSLAAIRCEAQETGVDDISDEQMQRLILPPRAAEEPVRVTSMR